MPAVTIDLFASGDAGWDTSLDSAADDIYHRAGYHRFAERVEDLSAHLAVVTDPRRRRKLVWPYLLRPIAEIPSLADEEGFDVVSVYGYPGPIGSGCDPDDPFVADACARLVELWRSQGAITVFTRFHPLLANEVWARRLPAPGPPDEGAIVRLGRTVAIDLRETEEAAVARYKKTLRQEISAARRFGLTTRVDESWSALGVFAELYRATMLRAKAANTYFFSLDDLETLKTFLDPEIHLFLTELNGRVAAAGLFTEHRAIVQAHLVGTDDAFRKLSPLKVLLDDVRRWAQDRGNQVLHLGGGRGGREDSLFAFKARFSPRREPFSIGRWVLDEAAYARVAETSAGLAEPRRSAANPDYFPVYRAPHEADPAEEVERSIR